MTVSNDITGYIVVLVFAVVVHESWRWLGALLGARVTETDDVFVWVRYVSSALVAALAMRFVFFPAGVLAEITFAVRIAAMLAAIAVFIATGRNLIAGIAAGCLVLVALGSP